MISLKIHRPKLTKEQWEQIRAIVEKEISQMIVPEGQRLVDTGEFYGDFWFVPKGYKLK